MFFCIASCDWSPRRGEEGMRQEQYFLKMVKDITAWIQEALRPPTEVRQRRPQLGTM